MPMYMAVTADKYELPLFVADTVWEMAKHFGVTENTVYSSISKGLSGKRNGYRFVKVEEVENELGGQAIKKT